MLIYCTFSIVCLGSYEKVFALAEVLVENQIGISKSSNSSRLVPETIISIFAALKKVTVSSRSLFYFDDCANLHLCSIAGPDLVQTFFFDLLAGALCASFVIMHSLGFSRKLCRNAYQYVSLNLCH